MNSIGCANEQSWPIKVIPHDLTVRTENKRKKNIMQEVRFEPSAFRFVSVVLMYKIEIVGMYVCLARERIYKCYPNLVRLFLEIRKTS
jgi:hypothetical protein